VLNILKILLNLKCLLIKILLWRV